MDILGWRLALRFGIKRANAFGTLFGASVASVLAAGVVWAAITVSNILTFGPVQVGPPLGPAVTLTGVSGLPSPIATGEKSDVKFTIEATQPVSDATVWLRLTADGTTLDDYNIVQIEYKHPGENSDAIFLAPSGGSLEGELKSGWTIPTGYNQTAEVEITFLPDAPTASYQLDLWVEGTVGAGSNAASSNAASSSSQHDVQATDAETFTPESLTVSVGDTVRWKNVGTKPHTITFSSQALTGSDLFLAGQDYKVTFDQVGTFDYVCDFHGGMTGTIIVGQ